MSSKPYTSISRCTKDKIKECEKNCKKSTSKSLKQAPKFLMDLT